MTSETIEEPDNLSNENVNPPSYNALRLQHASPEHLHITSRRCFIGPIPEGWLKSHRKSWYRRYLNNSDSSQRTATFSARPGISHTRSTTGLDGPSASARFTRSFPQPEDVDDQDGESSNSEDGQGVGNSVAVSEGEEDTGQLDVESNLDGLDDRRPGEASPDKIAQNAPLKPRPKWKGRLSAKGSRDKASTSSFVTAPMKPPKPKPKPGVGTSRMARSPRSSFVTAVESPANDDGLSKETSPNPAAKPSQAQVHQVGSLDAPASGTQPRSSGGDISEERNNEDSTTNLLSHDQPELPTSYNYPRPELLPSDDIPQPLPATSHGLVKFNIPPEHDHTREFDATNAQRSGRRKIWRRLRQGSKHPGEIVKIEKMLVRLDSSVHDLPADYNENHSLVKETSTVDRWKELVVVCRESTSEDADFSIQMYKTRVIPSKEDARIKRSKYDIPLDRRTTHVNLYSSLDKTLVIWTPSKEGKGNMMYILRPHSVANAVEWYTFIRHSLGSHRSQTLQVNVPDLSVSLQLENPFGELEASMTSEQGTGSDEAALAQAERAVASTIVQRSLKMLADNPEWSDVLESWLTKEKIGLAWKRYDRLEWVHGVNEQRMYGTIAMQQTHELELRPKAHYPTSARVKGDPMEEPSPVEGFLIRLTSQKGNVRRLGKMYFKRLYFTTHNHYLCYCRPAKALPPPPPKMALAESTDVPSASEIVDSTPLIYAVNPYLNHDGKIKWMERSTPSGEKWHDESAYKEAERRVNSMLESEGYINLSHVMRVQHAQRGNSPADSNVDHGPDVDFHEEVEDSRTEDGKTDQFDDNRTFELVMRNKLVIRLQAYDEVTKKEWMLRLRRLITYWKLRLANDMDELKATRRSNLERLEIDEESEAYIGQFGSKWEVTRSMASSKLFNMCGIACCRAITMSGTLYCKPTFRSTFQRTGVILCHGHLLVFHGTLRSTSGKEVPHIQHDRQAAIDLKNCYLYSGLTTADDLLYQNQTFDSNHPGHRVLPRVYLEDGWTSSDEDTMTCFVIWQPRNKSFFRANEDQGSGKARQRLRYVSKLGAPGRSIVFKARSRAERDRWVMSINLEIDRLQEAEDVRLVGQKM